MNGIIIIDKEQGFTSHDVVAKMRGICGQKKIGHTGTLDPWATGVLPVCLGSGTKLCELLTEKDKEYVAELLLGVETDTQDITGRALAEHTVNVTEEEVRRACESFLGEYEQVPPMYSAIKIDGKKLYELARAGKEVPREARTVKIDELEILDCSLPVVRFRVVCSRGTYIRTLCADIGGKLGCGGTMKSLRRTRSGSFCLAEAVTLDELQRRKEEGRLEEILRPVDSVFADCPALHTEGEGDRLLQNGNAIRPEQTVEKKRHAPGQRVRFYRADGRFFGVYTFEPRRDCYVVWKMFPED
ncbi:MAG: tRNA pseudouridine(55) synthase TruB [Roseburia sp.]|nr:tRNA pseudouridine(55) synthase TruB [Roseburia sp.]MCM1098420.1 tRNA pseudouridine(55) synthase TruB [Ruminococcus flavefaciens]